VLKLNDDELPLFQAAHDHPTIPPESVTAIDYLFNQFVLAEGTTCVAMTHGAAGSCIIDYDGIHDSLTGTPLTVVDTVGAGDAFTAALALGLAHEWPLERTHRFAAAAGAFACTVAGGSPVFPDHLTLAAFDRP
jgi:fructokinase